MKFTQDEAFKELEATLGNPQTRNISDRTIRETLETLMPLTVNDETELSDFVTSITPVLKSVEGNMRSDISAKIALIGSKKAAPAKQEAGAPAEPVPQERPSYEDDLAELKAFKERMEQEGLKAHREKVNQKIKSILTEQGANNEVMQDVAIRFTEIDYDLSPEEIATKCRKTYDEQYTRFMSQVGTPYGGTQSMAPASPVTKEQREAAIAENTKRFRANIPV